MKELIITTKAQKSQKFRRSKTQSGKRNGKLSAASFRASLKEDSSGKIQTRARAKRRALAIAKDTIISHHCIDLDNSLPLEDAVNPELEEGEIRCEKQLTQHGRPPAIATGVQTMAQLHCQGKFWATRHAKQAPFFGNSNALVFVHMTQQEIAEEEHHVQQGNGHQQPHNSLDNSQTTSDEEEQHLQHETDHSKSIIVGLATLKWPVGPGLLGY